MYKDTSCPVTGEPYCKCEHADGVVFLSPNHKDTLRKLFSDHAVYTKMVIVAVLDSRPEADFLTKRLLDNQPEIGDFLGQFIGRESGDAVTNLLTEHIKTAAAIVTKLRDNSRDIQKDIDFLFNNSERVAKALSGLPSSKLDYGIVHKEFDQHNDFVLALAKLHKKAMYEKEITTYDAYYVHMLKFSDMLCDGLIY